MATTALALLDAFMADIAAGAFSWTSDVGTEQFSSVRKVPRGVPLERLLLNAQFPLALVEGDHGRPFRSTPVWEDRGFTLRVFLAHGHDEQGESLSRSLTALGDALYDTFHHQQDNAVWLAGDNDDGASFASSDGTLLVVKTWEFSYRLRRS